MQPRQIRKFQLEHEDDFMLKRSATHDRESTEVSHLGEHHANKKFNIVSVVFNIQNYIK